MHTPAVRALLGQGKRMEFGYACMTSDSLEELPPEFREVFREAERQLQEGK